MTDQSFTSGQSRYYSDRVKILATTLSTVATAIKNFVTFTSLSIMLLHMGKPRPWR